MRLAGDVANYLSVVLCVVVFAVFASHLYSIRNTSAQEYKAWVGTVAPGVQLFEDTYVRCYMWYSNPPWCFEKGK